MKRPARVRASVTCVLPGLAWPGNGVGSVFASADTPALAAIIGRGTVNRLPAQPYLRWLGRVFGGNENLPWATYRQIGEDRAEALAAGEQWLCADPVSLMFTRDSLLLGSPGGLGLTPEETRTLIACLNEQFAELGSFHAASPERWYLRTGAEIGARFHPLDDVIGRPVAYFQPEGPNARFWARTLNEIQVVLYNHPLNQTRLEHGLPAANGIWLWGSGESFPATLHAPADSVVSADPLLRGLAQAAGARPVDPAMAGSPAHGRAGHTWWHNGELAVAALDGDFAAWFQALQQIESTLLQPLLQAWRENRLQSLHLLAPSDKALLEVRLDAGARWHFWRRPVTAAQLAGLLQSAPEGSVR